MGWEADTHSREMSTADLAPNFVLPESDRLQNYLAENLRCNAKLQRLLWKAINIGYDCYWVRCER